MNGENWEPTGEDIEWTLGHLAGLKIGGVWAPGGTGLEYERTGEEELTLRRITQHPESGEMHRRVLATLDNTDWMIDETQTEMVVPSLNPQEAQYQELLRQQEIAAQWDCPNAECDHKLVDMPLENGEWQNQGMQAALDDEGQGIEIERWVVSLECDECTTEFQIDPQDYGLLGGDDLFFQWRTPTGTFTVLTREQVVDLVDGGVTDDMCTPLGSEYNGGPVPLHMRGTYCMFAKSPPSEEGEEE